MRLIDIHAHLAQPPERMGTAFVTNLPTASAPRWQAASARTPLAQGVLHALLARQEPEDPTGARESLQEALALATELGMWPDATHRHLGPGKRYRRTSRRQDTRTSNESWTLLTIIRSRSTRTARLPYRLRGDSAAKIRTTSMACGGPGETNGRRSWLRQR